jgi:hypothetical protein
MKKLIDDRNSNPGIKHLKRKELKLDKLKNRKDSINL